MFASRAARVEVSGIRKMFEGAPPNAINLGLGEPDMQPPARVVEALKSAIDKGMNKYGPTGGIPELRQAVARRLSKYKDVKAQDVLITTGATEALCLSMQTFIDIGDEVLYPDPGFVLFKPHIKLASGLPVPYSLTEENGYLPNVSELKSLVTEKTKAIIVNSPSNPTGSVFSKKLVEEIVDFAREEDLIIISDEVYDEIIYEGEHESFLGKYDKLVYVNSFSKVFAMTGWRLGYLTAQPEVVQTMSKIHYFMVACPPTPTQFAVLAGLEEPTEFVNKMVKEFEARREIIINELNSLSRFKCLKPKGAFYAFPAYNYDINSEEVAMNLLKAGVICSPGKAFGVNGEKHVRFSYANSRENIKIAMERVKGYVEEELKGRVK